MININETNGDLKEMINNKEIKLSPLPEVYAYSGKDGKLLTPWFTTKIEALSCLLNKSCSQSDEYSSGFRGLWTREPFLVSVDTELDFSTYKTNSEDLLETYTDSFIKVNIIKQDDDLICPTYSPKDLPSIEQKVLGGILLDNSLLATAMEYLKTDDFTIATHGSIYQAMKELYSSLCDITPMTLGEKGIDTDILREINDKGITKHFLYHVKWLKEKVLRRAIAKAGGEFIKE